MDFWRILLDSIILLGFSLSFNQQHLLSANMPGIILVPEYYNNTELH